MYAYKSGSFSFSEVETFPKRDDSPDLRCANASSASLLPVPSSADLGRQALSPSPSLAGRLSVLSASRKSPSPVEAMMGREEGSFLETEDFKEYRESLPLDANSYSEVELALDAEMDAAYTKLSSERQKLYDSLAELVSPRTEKLKTLQLYLRPRERKVLYGLIKEASDHKLQNLVIDMKAERKRLEESVSEVTFSHLLRRLRKHL